VLRCRTVALGLLGSTLALASAGCVPVERNPADALVELQDPPTDPPELRVEGVTLQPVDWEWLRRDGWDDAGADEADLWRSLPRVTTGHHAHLELGAGPRPAELIAVTYDQRNDETAPPRSDSGSEAPCTDDSSVCRYDGSKGVSFVLALQGLRQRSVGAAIVVLHAHWEVSTGSDVVLDTATYAFRSELRA